MAAVAIAGAHLFSEARYLRLRRTCPRVPAAQCRQTAHRPGAVPGGAGLHTFPPAPRSGRTPSRCPAGKPRRPAGATPAPNRTPAPRSGREAPARRGDTCPEPQVRGTACSALQVRCRWVRGTACGSGQVWRAAPGAAVLVRIAHAGDVRSFAPPHRLRIPGSGTALRMTSKPRVAGDTFQGVQVSRGPSPPACGMSRLVSSEGRRGRLALEDPVPAVCLHCAAGTRGQVSLERSGRGAGPGRGLRGPDGVGAGGISRVSLTFRESQPLSAENQNLILCSGVLRDRRFEEEGAA